MNYLWAVGRRVVGRDLRITSPELCARRAELVHSVLLEEMSLLQVNKISAGLPWTAEDVLPVDAVAAVKSGISEETEMRLGEIMLAQAAVHGWADEYPAELADVLVDDGVVNLAARRGVSSNGRFTAG
jgi:hypothetical protein